MNLQDKLARSLDKANTKDKRKVSTPKPPPLGKCSKLSVSLFARDLQRLDAIRDYMASRGERISTSQAIKLALRTAPLSEDLAKALAAIRSEDGRKW